MFFFFLKIFVVYNRFTNGINYIVLTHYVSYLRHHVLTHIHAHCVHEHTRKISAIVVVTIGGSNREQ